MIAASAAAAKPWIGVRGSHLVDRSGRVVRLLGVNRSGTEYACQQGYGFFDGPSDAASIAAMKSWHINAVRVPLNETCRLGINGIESRYGGAAYRRAIRGWVSRLEDAGLYVILDLHWAAPGRSRRPGSSRCPTPTTRRTSGARSPSNTRTTTRSSSTSTTSRTKWGGGAGSTAA